MTSAAGVVDMAFTLAGERLPRDHATTLWRALSGALPWLADVVELAIPPIRAAVLADGSLAVNRRSRLTLRLPETRVPAALALCGTTLAVGAARLGVERAMTRALLPHGTLYSQRVACAADDEAAFVQEVTAALAALGVGGDFICGRRAACQGPDGELAGFSLMLTGLRPKDSLQLQVAGLGPHRRLGFGVFVPHRSTAAVGGGLEYGERRALRRGAPGRG